MSELRERDHALSFVDGLDYWHECNEARTSICAVPHTHTTYSYHITISSFSGIMNFFCLKRPREGSILHIRGFLDFFIPASVFRFRFEVHKTRRETQERNGS